MVWCPDEAGLFLFTTTSRPAVLSAFACIQWIQRLHRTSSDLDVISYNHLHPVQAVSKAITLPFISRVLPGWYFFRQWRANVSRVPLFSLETIVKYGVAFCFLVRIEYNLTQCEITDFSSGEVEVFVPAGMLCGVGCWLVTRVSRHCLFRVWKGQARSLKMGPIRCPETWPALNLAA
jgi:hypothetical protein